MILRCFLCLIGLEIFVLSTFAKNDPLIIKTSGRFVIWGGTVFLIRGKGLYEYALNLSYVPLGSRQGVTVQVGHYKLGFQASDLDLPACLGTVDLWIRGGSYLTRGSDSGESAAGFRILQPCPEG